MTDAIDSPDPALTGTTTAKPSLTERLATSESWLQGHRRLTLIALLLLASFLRLVTWTELQAGPCFYHYEHSEMDMLFFHDWAKAINDQSLLSDFEDPELRHPMHQWHWQVAKDYLIRNPTVMDGKAFEQEPIEAKLAAVHDLWSDWYRGKQFHQEPLYPYMLAGIYALVGESQAEDEQFSVVPRGVIIMYGLQMILGVLSVGMIYLLARRYFGDLAAVLAAGMTLGYAPLIYFEFILLRASWICFAGLLLVWMAERLRDQQTRSRWLAFGLVTGLVVMLKTTMLLFGLGAAAIILLPERKRGRPILAKLSLMAAGALIALSPVIFRNIAVGASALSMTSVGAVTFAASNYKGYLPSEGWNPLPPKGQTQDASMVSAIMGKSDGSLVAAIPATIDTHDGVFDYGGLLIEKFLQIWHWFEIPNNAKFYLFQLYSKVLQWLPTPFWLTAPFALYGFCLVLLRRREERQRSALLTLLIVTLILPMVAFYVLSRFRVPMVLAMSPFAAYGILSLLRERRRRHLLWTGLGLGLCMLLINREIATRQGQPERQTVEYFDIQNHMRGFWGPRIQQAENDEDYALAADLLSQFLDTMPPRVRQVTPQQPPTERFLAIMTNDYGSGYLRLAETLDRAGLAVRAARAQRRGDTLLAAAKLGWDRMIEADPQLKRLEEIKDKLKQQRLEGFTVQVKLKPPNDRGSHIAVVDANGNALPVLLHAQPNRPPTRGAALVDGKTAVLILSSDLYSIVLYDGLKEISRKRVPLGMTKDKATVNIFWL